MILLWVLLAAMAIVSLVAMLGLVRDYSNDERSISAFDKFREVMGRDPR